MVCCVVYLWCLDHPVCVFPTKLATRCLEAISHDAKYAYIGPIDNSICLPMLQPILCYVG